MSEPHSGRASPRSPSPSEPPITTSDSEDGNPSDPTVPAHTRRPVLIFTGMLIGIALTFYGLRLATDVPFLASGTQPEPEDFESRYVAHPWLAYLHMTPGVLYLLGAPLQLSERIRTKHYTLHRRLGRVLVPAAMLSVVLAIVFGLQFPWGGSAEAAATAVFGCWFLICLLLAVRAIRRGDVINHRRWMIRAFATGVGIGSIRIWIGVFVVTGLLDFHDSFAAAFWIALGLHVIAGEWWVRSTPSKTG
jgi:uncharacterized membrane protein